MITAGDFDAITNIYTTARNGDVIREDSRGAALADLPRYVLGRLADIIGRARREGLPEDPAARQAVADAFTRLHDALAAEREDISPEWRADILNRLGCVWDACWDPVADAAARAARPTLSRRRGGLVARGRR